MNLDEFISKYENMKNEFFIANGKQPASIEEFDNYIKSRKSRLSSPKTTKSLNWLFRDGRSGANNK